MKTSAYEKANFLSKFTFWWMVGFFIKLQSKKIKVSDLTSCPSFLRSETLSKLLERIWIKQIEKVKVKSKPSLLWAILKSIGITHLLSFIFVLIGSIANIVQTICLGDLIKLLYLISNGDDANVNDLKLKVYLNALVVALTQIIVALSYSFYWFMVQQTGMKVRIACSRLIYSKILKLSQLAFGKTTSGQIINHLSNDVSKFDFAFEFQFFLIIGVFELIMSLYILWPLLGVSSLIGFFVLFLTIPLQSFMGKAFSKLRSKGAEMTDERIRLMNEIIPAMRVIKMYTWEKPFVELVNKSRKNEISKIRLATYLKSINMSIAAISEKFIMFVILSSFVLLGNHLKAEAIFIAISLIRQLQWTITEFIPLAVSSSAEALISVQRIQRFLLLPEVDVNTKTKTDVQARTGVNFDKVNLSLDTKLILQNISFKATQGSLVTVVGPVGSGKSTLINSILNEIKASQGEIQVNGKISFCSQQPWIFAGTIRENILFNNEFNPDRYSEIIKVTALDRDLKLFNSNDMTFVNDRGASLSGGQKARINLARCLYAIADIYILDDPLSAVDANVANHIYHSSIKSFLSDKLTILTTHQLQFLKYSDKILFISDGNQICYDNFQQFLIQGGSKFIQNIISDHKKCEDSEKTLKSESESIPEDQYQISTEIEDELPFNETDNQLETNEITGIKSTENPFWIYLKSGTIPILIPIWILLILSSQGVVSFIEYYFSLWTDSEERKTNQILNQTNHNGESFVDKFDQTENIIFFTMITGIAFTFEIVRSISFFKICMRSSINLHNKMFTSICRATISFFDNNQSGIILNRVSRDTGIIDDLIPLAIYDTVVGLTANVGSVILMSIVNIYLLIPSIILITLALICRSKYVKVVQHVKRLEGKTKSPIFSHLSTTINGLVTIRSTQAQSKFISDFDKFQDEHTCAYFTWISVARLFVNIIHTISFLFTCSTIIIVLIAIKQLNGSSAGLIIVAVLSIANTIQWNIRQLTDSETMMTSVERVDELNHIESEAILQSAPYIKPDQSWPRIGSIAFKHVHLQYGPDAPFVLHDLNFHIEHGQRIGIVGRTGAGKSSLITILFRLVDFSGSIIIDGVNTKTINPLDLRKKISIIPQDPIIFTGTIRYNLDPFGERTDDQLMRALDQVQLMSAISSMGNGLDSQLTDGGSNLSVGQRQLVCLARAILNNNNILILDEATANIDPSTDECIQRIIREQFTNCTILTIAHRLNTIMDSDKIMVIDCGHIVQFDETEKLIQDKTGHFYSLLKSSSSSHLVS